MGKVRTAIDSAGLAFCWGPSYLCIKVALAEVPPLGIALFRVLVGAALLLLLLCIKRVRLPSCWIQWRDLFVMGLLASVFPFTLFGIGELYISSALAAILNGLVPVLTVVMAHYFLHDEPLTPGKIIGIALALTGFLTLIGGTLADGQIHGDTLGILAVAGAAASYACSIVWARKRLAKFPQFVAPAGQLICGTVVLSALFLTFEWDFLRTAQIPSAPVMKSLLYLGVCGTAMAFLFYYSLVARRGATAVAVVIYMLPVIGTILGVVFQDESLRITTIIGFVLILAGMLTANGAIRFPVMRRMAR